MRSVVIDVRTGQEIVLEEGDGPYIPEPEDPRMTARLSKYDFLKNCRDAGIMTSEDAIEAAKGNIPPSFHDAVPENDRDDVELKWASLVYVDRMHPFILAVAQELDISDEMLDMIFGL